MVEEKSCNSKITVINGLVIPVDWDQNGKIQAVSISSFDEMEYLVDNNDKGKELFDLLHQQLEVRGIIGLNEKRQNVITIQGYRKISNMQ